MDGAPNFPNCVSESNSLSFQLLKSGGDQTTIGEVIGNKNIVLENIEYSTIPVHTEQARALNIHPKTPL
jgi:hypothetical protein